MTRSSGRGAAGALAVAAILAARGAAAQAAARDLIWRAAPLAGNPGSALTDGDPAAIRVEGYDASGRLVLLSLAMPKPASEEGAGTVAEPPKTRTTTYAYDASGSLAAISVEGEDASSVSTIDIRRDSDGRPLEARARDSGSLSWTAAYDYSGSFDSALVVYRDGAGAPLAADEVRFGAGASDGRAVSAIRRLPGGALAGEARASVDARGALSGFIAAAAGSEESPAADPAEVSDGEAEGPRLPALGFLLFPRWPGEAPWRGAAPELSASPFPAPTPESPGRADFLYDAAGRLVLARLFDAADAIVEEARYAYDARGFLARELRSRFAGPAAVELREYRYPAGGAGGWTSRDVYRMPEYIEGVSGDWELLPLERQTRSTR